MSHRKATRETKQRPLLHSLSIAILVFCLILMSFCIEFFLAVRSHGNSSAQARSYCSANQTPVPYISSTDGPVIPSGIISVLLPAYWGTDQASWDHLIQQHPPGTIAIVNAGNQPGTYSPLLKTQIELARQAGIKVIGYVNTGFYQGVSHANRDINAIENDINAWFNYYPLDGIQLANALLSPANLPFYSSLHDYIKSMMGPNVIANIVYINGASVPSSRAYMQVADILKIYENALNGYQNQMPTWIQEYPSSRFAATVSKVLTTQIPHAIQLSLEANIGYVYILDQGLNYQQLPPFWDQEVAALESYDTTGNIPTVIPQPTTTPSPLPTAMPTATTPPPIIPPTAVPTATTPPPIIPPPSPTAAPLVFCE